MHLKRPGTSPLKKDLGYVEKNVVNQQNIFLQWTSGEPYAEIGKQSYLNVFKKLKILKI